MGDIIKISSTSTVSAGETLVLDTNVLLWTYYSKIPPYSAYQTQVYPTFVSNAIQQGNPIVITAFCLNEMLHVIEKTELDLYNRSYGISGGIGLKKFRKIPTERSKVRSEIDLILRQIKAIPNLRIVKSKATRKTIDSFMYDYHSHLADFFDFCLISFCNSQGFSVVSDDIDFANPYCKVRLYSANPKV